MKTKETVPGPVVTVGEVIVEFMRLEKGLALDKLGTFRGPFPSGAPANFIDCFARLGGTCAIIGAVGKDRFGDCVVNRLRADGVDVSHVAVRDDLLTAIAFVSYFDDGSREFVFHFSHSASASISPDLVEEDFLAGTRFIHVTGSALSFSDSAREACYKAVDIVKRNGGKVSFDPNLRPELMSLQKIREVCEPVLAATDLFLPSGPEAMMFSSREDPEEACIDLQSGGMEIVALKRGEAGSVIFTDGERLEVPSFKVEEVDPTGAGDCYGAAFVYGLLKGWDLLDVGRFANAAGALATTRRGAMEGTFSEDEIKRFIRNGKL